MIVAKLSNSGQVEIPQEVRSWLNLQPGDSIDFVIESDGKVYLQPHKMDVRELSGMLYEVGRKAVSVEEMEIAIALVCWRVSLKGLDTNVLVRFLVRDDEQQWQIADRYINEALEADERCLINNIENLP